MLPKVKKEVDMEVDMGHIFLVFLFKIVMHAVYEL